MTVAMGDRLELNGRDYEVLRGKRDGALQFEALDDGTIMNMSRNALMERIMEGHARLLSRYEEQYPPFFSDPTTLPEHIKSKLQRKLAYVRAWLKTSKFGTAEEVLLEIRSEVARKIEDPNPPGPSTMYRWRKIYLDADEDERALIDRADLRGNRTRRLDGRVIDTIRQMIREKYMILERPSMTSIKKPVSHHIDKINDRIPERDHLPYPSTKALYRELAYFEPYELTKARYGKREADYQARAVGKGAVTERPLERVEIDHTPIDIILVDDIYGLPIGRPNLTLLIDHYSRMPVGYYIGFIPPGRQSIMSATRMAIAPKNWIHELYPEIKNDWPCCGVPEAIVTDNGKEFHSRDFEIACDCLHISIEHTRVKEPWAKGVVERFFKEVNHTLVGSLPGKTFHNAEARGDYDSVGKACIRVSAFKEIFCTWLVDVYARTPHSGIGDIPMERWNRGISETPVNIFTTAEKLNAFLSFVNKKRQVHEKGIVLQRIWYQSERLQDIRRRTSKRATVSIKIDPEDLGRIVVIDAENKDTFSVPAVDQEYADKLPMWQHQIILRVCRENQTNLADVRELAAARQQIDELADNEVAAAKTNRTHKTLGRYMEENAKRLLAGKGEETPQGHTGYFSTEDEDEDDYDDDYFDDEEDTTFVTYDRHQLGKTHEESEEIDDEE